MNFGHAGILYQNSFVMYDRETESLWVHVTGKAEVGPLKGQQLEFMPSTVTNWATWKRHYPGTLVLPGYRRGGFMGTYAGLFENDIIGLAVVVGFQGKLFPFSALTRENVVNDEFNGSKILVIYSPEEGTATAWNRDVNGRILNFEKSDRKDDSGHLLLRDTSSGSLWFWLTGKAVEGQLKGRQLEQLLYNPILNERFLAFYPDGPVYEK